MEAKKKMNQFDEEVQMSHLAPKKCHTCYGKGTHIKYIPMPGGTLQKTEVLCQMCNGRGMIDFVDEIENVSPYKV